MKASRKGRNKGDNTSVFGTYALGKASIKEGGYGFLAGMAADICSTDRAFIHLITEDRTSFESQYGLILEKAPLQESFCSFTIQDPRSLFVVQDTRKDDRFWDHPLVKGNPPYVYYAGVPLLSTHGIVLGVLSVVHHKTHTLNKKQGESLKALAHQIVQLLELGKLRNQLDGKEWTKGELHLSEQRFKALVENGADAIAIIGIDGKASYVSPSITRVLGYTEEGAMALNLFEVVHPVDVPQLTQKMEEALQRPGVPIKGHTSRTKHKNGSWRWLEATITNMLHDPNIGGIVDNFRDVTDKILAEKELKVSEKKYRTLFHSSPLPKWIYERKSYKIVDVNQRALETYGYSREEFLQMDLFQLRPVEEIPKLLESQKREKPKTGNIHFGIFTHKKRNGDLIKVDLNGQQIQFNDKDCMMVVSLDVTERVLKQEMEQLERALIERSIKQDAKLERLLEEFLMGVEKLFPGMKASILKIRNDKVQKFVAPSLSPEFTNYVHNLPIGPKNGSCGSAAFYGRPIIVTDIAHDPLWEDYREPALEEGLRASWSQPIFDSEGKVFATFANYYPSIKSPTDPEMEYFSRAASLLGLILESEHKKNALSQSNERFEYVNKATDDAIYDWDIPKDHLTWGESFKRIFGHDTENKAFPLAEWEKLLHPEDAPSVDRSLQEFLGDPKRERWHSKYRLKKAKGTYAFIEEIGHVIRNSKGNPLRMIGVLRDISARTREEQRMKLMENVITNTTDAVLITEAAPLDAPGPKIVFVNDAFTQMTGYRADEVIGKSPRILQGPKTDRAALKKLRRSMERWEPYEMTTVNYKKNGDEFWINFSISPVTDIKGTYTHWIAIERDVTQQKNLEFEKELLHDLGQYFNREENLQSCLAKVTAHLTKFGDFAIAEIWLPNFEKLKLRKVASHSGNKSGKNFLKASRTTSEFDIGAGLPGTVWKKGEAEIWDDVAENEVFVRRDAAKKSGLRAVLGMPLLHNGRVVGIMVLGTDEPKRKLILYKDLLKKLETFMGSEIKRKRLENELNKIFAFVPDIICLLDFYGKFRKINAAGCELLGYEEEELYNTPPAFLVYPEDRDLFKKAVQKLSAGETIFHFENRCMTKDGDTVWLSWTCNTSVEEGLVYAVAKNITEQKELQELLRKSNELAKIGSWEVDFINNTVFWSDITKQLHEVDAEYEPDMPAAINFYKVGDSRETLKKAVKQAVEEGTPFDLELKLVTAKGNERWVRTIGQAEMSGRTCLRIFGSFQDIHHRKDLELRLKRMADNLPGVIFQYYIYPDGSDRMLYVSNRSQEIWGMQPKACMEDHSPIMKRIEDAGDMGDLQRSMVQSAKSMESWNQQWRYLHPDGELRWHEGYGAPYKMADGTIVWDSLVLDITDKKELEGLLKRTTNMARIGSWNMDLLETGEEDMYWSPMTRNILEVDEDYSPTLSGGLEFYQEDSKVLIKEAIDTLITNGKEFDLELLLATAKGNSRWVRCIGQAERINEKTVQIFGSFQDIHQRKIAELDLKRTYEERNTILESIGDGFFAVDKNWIITYFNQQAENILYRKREEMLGQNLWEIYTDAIELDFYRQYHHAMDTGEMVLFEDYYPTLDIWVEISIYPSENGLSVYFKDISVRKLAEEQLRQSNERFEKVTEATNDAIWDWDIQHDTIYWGPGFQTLFGYEVEKVVPTIGPWMEHIHPEDREGVTISLEQAIQDPNLSNWSREYRYLKANGEHAHVVDRGVILRDEHGKGLRMVGAMTDITHRKEYEESLKNLNSELEKHANELERSNSELEQFAFVASHDLQEPLRMVTSFLALLERKYGDLLDDKGRTYIDFASGGAKRMKQIILDLLEFSRVGKLVYEKEAIDLNIILEEYLVSRNKMIAERSAKLIYKKLPVLTNYGPPLLQILHNLLDNAIKYTAPGTAPIVKMSAVDKDQYWQFSIADNGIGIQKEYFGKIFNIFQRLHNREDYSGTGIGLAIVKKNIEGLGGKIWLESTPGQGSTFYFTIPK